MEDSTAFPKEGKPDKDQSANTYTEQVCFEVAQDYVILLDKYRGSLRASQVDTYNSPSMSHVVHTLLQPADSGCLPTSC